jgi:hypothetical protein
MLVPPQRNARTFVGDVRSHPHPAGNMLADVKWRYMWRVGPRPQSTQYAELNSEPVVPQVRLAADLQAFASLSSARVNAKCNDKKNRQR